MIIHIRGTHGSGKSTLVRKIMETYKVRKPVRREGRKQPIGYILKRKGHRDLFVVGHYESACGGGDTVPKVDDVYRLVRKHAQAYDRHVIFEGILAQHSMPRLLDLANEPGFARRLRVVILNTSIKKSIKSVKKRRRARGDTRSLNPSNIIKEQRGVDLSRIRLKTAGIKVKTLSRSDALTYITSLL
jgi:hypothetical protein